MPHFKTLALPRAAAAALVIAASGPVHAQLGSTVTIAATEPSGSSDTSAAVLHQADNGVLRWQESTDANQIRVPRKAKPTCILSKLKPGTKTRPASRQETRENPN